MDSSWQLENVGLRAAYFMMFTTRYRRSSSVQFSLSCGRLQGCRYGHQYELSEEDLNIMRVNAKKSPCGYANRTDTPCPFGDTCPLGHSCPSGPRCKFLKSQRCKFVGTVMHSEGIPTPKSSSEASAAVSEELQPMTDYGWLHELGQAGAAGAVEVEE